MIQFRKRFMAEEQACLPDVPGWMSDLLRGRGIDTVEKAKRFLHPSLDLLVDPGCMQDMEKALQLIRGAIARGDRILVYGDYDVDGICACTILLETLREEGARADFRIPSRQSEGYGLNRKAVEEIAGEYQLLITVDCGISSVEEVRLARELGMTVIVTDHHELPADLPPADAVLNPLLGDYPFRRLCGAGVALKICQAMRGLEGLEKQMEIAALATVADIVPLTDENRVIVREGMLRMAATARPGLRALMENAQVKFPVRSDDIAFRLGPRLNAAGRLEDAAQGVRLLMTRDEAEAREIAAHLEENNRKRQATEQNIMDEAMACFPAQVDLRKDRVIILDGKEKDWKSGLIGLVAGKLCERFHHPAIVLSRQGENAVGSCRSIPGINIYQALDACKDLFLRFGGHEQAAGLTIPVANIPEFRKRLNRVIRETCDDRCFLPVKEYDEELSLQEVTLETIGRLADLEPTGFGNPAPVFLARNAAVQEMRRVGKDGSHLRLALLETETGILRGGIGFGLGAEADWGYGLADVLFRPERNEFRGEVTPQMQVQAIRPAGLVDGDGPADGPARNRQNFVALLQEMSRLASKKAEYGDRASELRPEYLLKERFEALRMTDEELRAVYVRLRRLPKDEVFPSPAEMAKALGETEERLLTALTAFCETKLLTWQLTPFAVRMTERPAKCAMTDSALIRYLRFSPDGVTAGG